ncbi:serine hydrolase family protein [Helicobacter didelphidarum]|uniref:Serine hydrolase family protein n=2 Tax=Helicobacter didelphidarum TaxID=2040648 RepID=A0A3D8IQX1_9HELI|nr:serine hydrolase family protein [Helicobacter didelphidarum]
MRVYIVHGFDSSPDKNWFRWLEDKLKKKDISVDILSLPNPQNPNLTKWIATLDSSIKLGHETYLVGHSLGCITILQYLQSKAQKTNTKAQSMTDKKNIIIGGFVLVSGFYESLSILPQLDSFLKPPLDFTALKALSPNRVVISAKDDMIVPTELSKNLSHKLSAKFIQTQNGGHFMESDGYTEMPLVLESLEAMFKK